MSGEDPTSRKRRRGVWDSLLSIPQLWRDRRGANKAEAVPSIEECVFVDAVEGSSDDWIPPEPSRLRWTDSSAVRGVGRVHSAERLKAYTDAVLAIVATSCAVPLWASGGFSGHEAFSVVRLVPYVTTFQILSRFWEKHCQDLSSVEQVDERLATRNAWWLAALSLLPFSFVVLLYPCHSWKEHLAYLALWVGNLAMIYLASWGLSVAARRMSTPHDAEGRCVYDEASVAAFSRGWVARDKALSFTVLEVGGAVAIVTAVAQQYGINVMTDYPYTFKGEHLLPNLLWTAAVLMLWLGLGSRVNFRLLACMLGSNASLLFNNLVPRARVELFSDGVYAASATGLMIELLGSMMGPHGGERRNLWPRLVNYCYCFHLVGRLHRVHQTIVSKTALFDQDLLALNSLICLLVAFLPVLSTILDDEWQHRGGALTAAAAYVLLVSLSLLALMLRAVKSGRLDVMSAGEEDDLGQHHFAVEAMSSLGPLPPRVVATTSVPGGGSSRPSSRGAGGGGGAGGGHHVSLQAAQSVAELVSRQGSLASRRRRPRGGGGVVGEYLQVLHEASRATFLGDGVLGPSLILDHVRLNGADDDEDDEAGPLLPVPWDEEEDDDEEEGGGGSWAALGAKDDSIVSSTASSVAEEEEEEEDEEAVLAALRRVRLHYEVSSVLVLPGIALVLTLVTAVVQLALPGDRSPPLLPLVFLGTFLCIPIERFVLRVRAYQAITRHARQRAAAAALRRRKRRRRGGGPPYRPPPFLQQQAPPDSSLGPGLGVLGECDEEEEEEGKKEQQDDEDEEVAAPVRLQRRDDGPESGVVAWPSFVSAATTGSWLGGRAGASGTSSTSSSSGGQDGPQ